MTFIKTWPAPERPGFFVTLVEALRENRLLGKNASRFGGPDELLLHSGGPVEDDSKLSLLMGPPTIRARCHQPLRTDYDEVDGIVSALKGAIHLAELGTPQCTWTVDNWCQGQWVPNGTVGGPDLGSALRSLDSLLLPKIEPSDPVTIGGFAGLLTYDLAQWTQPLRFRYLPKPNVLLGLLYRCDRWIVCDRSGDSLSLLASHADEWTDRCADLFSRLPASQTTDMPEPPAPVPFFSKLSDREHAEAVDTVRSSIRDGFFYQLNFGREWHGSISDPWQVFSRLVVRNPAPYAGWLQCPDLRYAVVSASPELLLKLNADEALTRPIKGTRPRGTGQNDENQLQDLSTSRKDIAEHTMIVDLERNDLRRVCRAGTVHWNRWRLETHPTVHHMVSDVRGQLRDDKDGWDALTALFPGGSITGCPKTATVAAINELEKSPRGAWTGSLGYHDPRAGVACWNILIRTLEAYQLEDDTWHARVRAGGGLVTDSDPDQEVEEAKWKAQALQHAAWGEAPTEVPIGEMMNLPVPKVKQITNPFHAYIHGEQRTHPHLSEPQMWAGSDAPLSDRDTSRGRCLVIDNLDSFSWNIIHLCAELGAEVVVVNGRGVNVCLDVSTILGSIRPSHVILGPGPGRPIDAPLTRLFANTAMAGELLDEVGGYLPVLGICLGHQALGEAAGWQLDWSPQGAVHGSPDLIVFKPNQLFDGLPVPCRFMRYHSLSLLPTNDRLQIIATDFSTRTLPMAICHSQLPLWGVQFHPESCGSPDGRDLLSNFLTRVP